ncbi:NADH:flavin oxidoreductase [Pelagibacterium sp.]|uniref:NADH:flavin oxidoreductase n=1 Tax=Pelagibacterium sp. TaxID=1967288 RepID=UPI003A906C00
MPQHELFQPGVLGGMPLRNRTLVAPMTRISADASGEVGPLMQTYYEAFGKGGFAAIVTEGVYTDQYFSQGYEFQPGITTEAQAASWSNLIKGVHSTGAKVILQLMHAGALSQYNRHCDDTRGPSAVQPKGSKMPFYRGTGAFSHTLEMSSAEISAAIAGFVQSAQRAQDAGADGVEIHGANGYLLDQFLTDYTNRRSDRYGGTLRDRIRLTCEVIERVRNAVDRNFTVGVRISQGKVNDFTHKWAGGVSDAQIIFKAMEASGANYIHTTEFAADAPAFEQGKSLAAMAKSFTSLPVIANGGLGDREIADRMIATGDCDFVAIGKAALAAPDWPTRARNGQGCREFDFEMFSPLANLETANAFALKNA